MRLNLRWLITLGANYLVLFLIQMINSSLAPISLYLYLNALFVVVPALMPYPFTSGLLCVLMTALAVDSYEAIPFGTSVVYFGIAYTGIVWFRTRFKAYSPRHVLYFTQIANAALYLVLSIQLGRGQLMSIAYWVSVAGNLMVSQTILAIVSPWFLNFQASMLEFTSYEINYKKKKVP